MNHRRTIACLILGALFVAAACSSSPRYVPPGAVVVRQPTENRAAAPRLEEPVLLIVNPKRQRLYDVARRHYPKCYAEEHSMCMAAPFLSEVNPHVRDIYDVAPGTTLHVPSAADYRRWLAANSGRWPQSATFDAPKR